MLALALLTSLVSAHFVLVAPPSFGFDDINEDKAPCGGPTTGPTTPFTNSSVLLRIADKNMNIKVFATSGKDFKGTPVLLAEQQFTTVGEYTVNFDLTKIPEFNAVGSTATLQVVGDGSHGKLYQCANIGKSDTVTTTSSAAGPTVVTKTPTGPASYPTQTPTNGALFHSFNLIPFLFSLMLL
ncbi:hypothetical protein BC833DRAFT_552613 [Globomyces pollinis-pini]|nr:hypothetical protein BC833DRAFT_552613 [Globomyces pollinis-pini]